MIRSFTNLKFIALLTIVFAAVAYSKRSDTAKILVFSKTAGFHHESIPNGISAIQRLGEKNNFEVDTTTNANIFTEDSLKQYSAVVFLNTTGDVLNNYQEADFERYMQAGGGYVGIHAAADTEYDWDWYGRLVGGYFSDHPGINDPNPNVQEGTLHIENPDHATTEFLPENWTRTDEWYSYKNLNKNVNVLLTLDENSYKGGADMGNHPIAWYHEYDGGRAFYTGLGHTQESFTEDLYLQHVLAGIRYAIGENYELDYSKATTQRVPDANRFSKVTLSRGEFFEPTEMTVLPNKDVLIAQRRGEISLYKDRDSTLSRAGFLDVYFKTDAPNVNAEEGLLGIQADPDFEENHHVFVFYSPADTSVNRLSRFTMENDTLSPESEVKVLEFYSQRDICCHTGGSIAFDGEGLLYLSTGDNTTPFNEPDQKYVSNGFAPLDGRPGHEQYDARRSSGNSNDLRGKILRIRVNDDGSYDIPEGNLYPEGKANTRPEIYVQGNRNPYRISVDKKTGFLYWGEVGPDADYDSLATRGPRGYDEVNQAREAGFFGWPLFVGDNYAYHRFDYATGESGEAYDPSNPVNSSPNNTGIEELPPAQPAFIWYPYAKSEEFPQVGTGGRNAMAGPVYYTDQFPEESRLPEYYDGKLFIYDWIRNWIKVVTMKPNGDFEKMEPFMADTDLNALIDMEVGPDGQLYLLEYGSGWFSRNDDSELSRVNFIAGNMAPEIGELSIDKTSGSVPLEINARIEAEDPEQDKLTYTWNLVNGETLQTEGPQLTHTFETKGEYELSVEISDGEDHTVKSPSVSVYAGNTAPKVNITIDGNRTFYFAGRPVAYSVSVEDPDTPEEDPDMSTAFISADYVEGTDLVEASQGHKIMTNVMSGKNLIGSSDCQACHKVQGESIGPSYTAIAEKYQDSADSDSFLSEKIIKGGSGVWGERVMPGHPEVSEADARKMVAWIRSLGGSEDTQQSLPPTGEVDPTQGTKATQKGTLILSASYTDKGGGGVKPLTGNESIYMRNNTMTFENASEYQGYTDITYEGNFLMIAPSDEGSFLAAKAIDFTDITSVDLISVAQNPVTEAYRFELRLDSPDGKKIGEVVRDPDAEGTKAKEGSPIIKPLRVKLTDAPDGELHDLYIVSRPVKEEASGNILLSTATFNSGK